MFGLGSLGDYLAYDGAVVEGSIVVIGFTSAPQRAGGESGRYSLRHRGERVARERDTAVDGGDVA
jgi:hypothetical protein